MQKPDGCVMIEDSDIPQKLFRLKLRAFNSIGSKMQIWLDSYGIDSIEKLYATNKQQMCSAWGSIEGVRYYDKLEAQSLITLKMHAAVRPLSRNAARTTEYYRCKSRVTSSAAKSRHAHA